jgi:membrane associated rhomboid family serine protease
MQVVPVTVPSWLPLQQLFLAVAVVGSLVVARRLSSRGRWSEVLRRRFVLGVPWGTVLTVLSVLLVYWVVQGGWSNPRNPVVIPFRSWSYFYPVGTVFAGLAHNGQGHITGNLLGTVVFAPVVEYVIGHYPRERGAESFSSVRTNPFARILALPAGSFVAGLFSGVFALGPVIGFSGVVFAYAGFAFVTRPLVAVFALVSERTVGLLYRAVRNPRIVRKPTSVFVTPWWSDVAIQGHAVGILFGAVLGIWLLRRRGERPDPLYLWFAALVYGISESLWAVYAPLGGNRYALFRAIGVGLVFAFTALVASAVTASERPLSARVGLPRRRTAARVLVGLLVALSAVAVPFGFTTVDGDLPADAETVQVRDYTVTYVEGVPNQYVPSYNVSFSLFGEEYSFGSREASGVTSSGVVVFSEQRRAWIEAVSKGRLAFRGRAVVRVGGVGWRDRVFATRRGWSLQGNGSTYKVYLRRDGGQRRLAYRTDRVTAEPIVDGQRVAVRPNRSGFDVVVTRGNRTLGRRPVPLPGNETRVGGLTVNRTGRTLYAVNNETRVKVAKKSVPEARQN